jgi:hypothetical protein
MRSGGRARGEQVACGVAARFVCGMRDIRDQ